jgi:hypothetical protein
VRYVGVTVAFHFGNGECLKNNHLTSYDWLNALNNLELLSLHSEILTQLRSRGVIRTKNNPVGDYAEWLVSNALV